MALRLHNSLTGAKEVFEPLHPGAASVYACGPTVYGHTHLGNFRAFLFYDLLHRHLDFSGLAVTLVMNITDIDDKIIRRAADLGMSAAELVRPFEADFLADLASLRVRPAHVYPRATEHIGGMIDLIERLLASNHAYRADADVYFRVASFPRYGELAKLDRAGLRPGARVAQDDYDKESATDFALWKGEDPLAAQVGAVWDAPFGRGRPGWHIECSAMSGRYLGDTFDIHCGGVDLMFPHHENEIAQSEAASGERMARFWLHNGHLVDSTGEKMARRVGNISTLRELLEAGHDPLAIRFFLIANAHYRSRLTMDESSIRAAAEQVRRLQDFATRLQRLEAAEVDDSGLRDRVAAARQSYLAALDDDLNLPQAVGHLFDAVREGNAALDRGQVGRASGEALKRLLEDADRHLGIITPAAVDLEPDLRRLIEEREQARSLRDFGRSDVLRAELAARGILLEDSREGVRWRRG